MAERTREELEAMDREELKALADEMGLEYSSYAHTNTLVDMILEAEAPPDKPPPGGGGPPTEPPTEEIPPDEEEAPNYYPATVYSPWELPASTVAAQMFVDNNPGAVDTTIVLDDARMAQARDHISIYGDPTDPRLGEVSQSEEEAQVEEEVPA